MTFAEGSDSNLNDFSFLNNDPAFQDDAGKSILLKISGIEPTILFRNGQNSLMQAVDATIVNEGQAVEGTMIARFRQIKETRVDIGTIKAGEGKYRIFVPEVPVPRWRGFVNRALLCKSFMHQNIGYGIQRININFMLLLQMKLS